MNRNAANAQFPSHQDIRKTQVSARMDRFIITHHDIKGDDRIGSDEEYDSSDVDAADDGGIKRIKMSDEERLVRW